MLCTVSIRYDQSDVRNEEHVLVIRLDCESDNKQWGSYPSYHFLLALARVFSMHRLGYGWILSHVVHDGDHGRIKL